jgi:HD-GYP domain-containing protein (c-di-GMP phosphodiesterase class II)
MNADDNQEDYHSWTEATGIAAMTDTKELIRKIAALRTRLNNGAEPMPAKSSTTSAGDPIHGVAEKVQRGAVLNTLIESTLRSATANEPAPAPTPRLTARGARLLRQGRDALQTLRTIADDPLYQETTANDALSAWHHQAAALIEVVLRTAQAFPAEVGVQLRLCDGLEQLLTEVDRRTTLLKDGLAARKRANAGIDELAGYLRQLAVGEAISLTPLQAIADGIIADAKFARPLRFLYAAPADPTRFAAAHGLTVAQVMARVLLDDAEWQAELQLAIMAAMVHDVGMVRVPAAVLMTAGPLSNDQRRLIEKHTTISESMLHKLWPGRGWPVEAARDHHERNDGTGYPQGRRDIQISSYAKLLAVCDVYAALCAPRPHRAAFDTRTALTETLLLAERDYLDKKWAERLLLLSFYPVGSVVELSDGMIALVVGAHPDERGITHPGQPIVQLIQDADCKPLAWPLLVDLLEQRERSVLRSLNAEERATVLAKHFPHLSVHA